MADETTVELKINDGGNAAESLDTLIAATEKLAKNLDKVTTSQQKSGEAGAKAAKQAKTGLDEAIEAETKYQDKLEKIIAGRAESNRIDKDLQARGIKDGKGGGADSVRGFGDKFSESGIGKLGIAGAVGTAAVMASSQLAKGYAAATDATMTYAQRMEKVGTELVPFYGTITEMRRNLDGTNNKIKADTMRFEVAHAQLDASMQINTFGQNARIMKAGGVAAQGAAQAFQVAPQQFFDRTTASGVFRQQEEAQRKLAVDELLRAKREAAIADGKALGIANEMEASSKRLAASQGAYAMASAKVADIMKRENEGDRQKAGLNEALLAQKLAGAKVTAEAAQNEELVRSHMEAQNELAMRNSQVRKAEIGQMRSELEILKTREQITAASATRVGGMHKGHRMLAVQAVKHLKQHGIENATPEMIQAAESIAPLWVQKMKEKSGENSPEFKQLQDMGEIDDFTAGQGKNLKELRAAQDKVAVNIQ